MLWNIKWQVQPFTVKYSKLCESMTILAPVHPRGIQINGGISVWKCDNQLTTFLQVYA